MGASCPQHVSKATRSIGLSGPPNGWQDAFLHYVNIARAAHGACEAEWDEQCEHYAQLCADKCVADAYMDHSYLGQETQDDPECGKWLGQCIAGMSGWQEPGLDAKTAKWGIGMWYSELEGYIEASGDYTMAGHFNQLVFQCDSMHIGAALAGPDANDEWYIVCNFDPCGCTDASGEGVQAECEGDVSELTEGNDFSYLY